MVVTERYKKILTLRELAFYVQKIQQHGSVSLDTETTGLNIKEDRIVGVSFSILPNEGVYIPIRHKYPGCPKQIPADKVFMVLKKVLEDPDIRKAGHNLKYDYHMFLNEGITLRGPLDDTKVLAYLIAPNEHNNHLAYVAEVYVGHGKDSIKNLIGTGKKAVTMDQVDIDAVAPYAANDAMLVAELLPILKQRVQSLGLLPLYEQIEMPLLVILAKMEQEGIQINKDILAAMSVKLQAEADCLEQEVYSIAGETFNLNSPKQLRELLFGKLGMSSKNKTKGGVLSTNVETLETLKARYDHPIIDKILGYRHLAKLLSTYINALPGLTHGTPGRVHTDFSQTVAATGRLASSKPNLQNIPARDEKGQEIRRAFVAKKGYSLLVADYSQIELRLLAHLSGDQGMIRVFNDGRDIHQETADSVFKGTLDPKDARFRAKIINFSINYGTSARSLAKELKTTEDEAKQFMFKYFCKYRRVKEYMDECIFEAKEQCFASTILGRKRPIPELYSDNRAMASFGERVALNHPIQGSAADIVKIAMIQTVRCLEERGLKTKLLLQVHDELIFEVPEKEIELAKKLITLNMENLNRYNKYLPVKLAVPITVNIGVGPNWADAKE